MKKLLFSFLLLPTFLLAKNTDWSTQLWLGNGELWHSRIPVEVENPTGNAWDGEPVALQIGQGENELPLGKQLVQSVRLVDDQNTQLLYGLWDDAQLQQLQTDAIPDRAQLVIPVVCPAKGKRTYWIYFDNPSAWRLADSWNKKPVGSFNGDFELGAKDNLTSWGKYGANDTHQLSIDRTHPFSGKQCIRADAKEGAKPTWFGWKMSNIPVYAGSDVTIRVHVRGKNVKGYAGWYIHAGNSQKSDILNRVFSTGKGDFDWREQTIHIKVPKDCNALQTGTVLYGTGTAWFDDFKIEITPKRPAPPTVKIGKTERLRAKRIGETAIWRSPTPSPIWKYRLPIRIPNLTGKAIHTLSACSLSETLRATRYPVYRLFCDDKEISTAVFGRNLLFNCDLAPNSITTYYLYVGSDPTKGMRQKQAQVSSELGSDIPSDQVLKEQKSATNPKEIQKVLSDCANLLKNPSFEEEPTPEVWPHDLKGPGITLTRPTEGSLLGKRHISYTISPATPKAYRGLRQTINVEPGKSYLYGCWMSCKNLTYPTSLYLHLLDSDGKVYLYHYHSSHPEISGTSDWTPSSGMVTIPDEGVTKLQLHLTTEATGTLSYDQVFVAEFTEAKIGFCEGRPQPQTDQLLVEQIDPVIKVFKESDVQNQNGPFSIFLARNETEPLQLAIRSSWAVDALKVELESPKNAKGKQLKKNSVGWIGYVPIDFKTSYYHSKTPAYRLKHPSGGGGSDGWPGWWPDPIAPTSTGTLSANTTQGIWLSFQTDSTTEPGLYTGSILWKQKDKLIRKDSIQVAVWNFAIPPDAELPAIYDFRLGNQWTAGGKTREQAEKEILAFMHEKKICPDSINANISLERDKRGKITADFTRYDQVAEEYFTKLHFQHSYTPGVFYLFGWEHPPKKFLGEEPYEGKYPYADVDRTKLRPAYRKAYQEALRLYWNHMKAKGWEKKIALYISDEPYLDKKPIVDQMKAICDMIHEVSPDIRVYCSTWRHCKEWNGYLDIWGIGHYGCFPVKEMKARIADGDSIWFTTDGQMCTDTPYCAVERMLPHYCHAYGAKAYEFWGCTWLTYDPWKYGWHSYIRQSSTPGEYYYVRYPAGDGYLMYPERPGTSTGPVTSIRLESARDGVEDYSYLKKLDALALQKNSRGEKAKALLKKYDALLAVPNAGGRYSTQILPEPEIIEKLRREAGSLLSE